MYRFSTWMYFLLFQLRQPECNDHSLYFPESFSKEPRDLSIQDNYREIGTITKELKMHTQKHTYREYYTIVRYLKVKNSKYVFTCFIMPWSRHTCSLGSVTFLHRWQCAHRGRKCNLESKTAQPSESINFDIVNHVDCVFSTMKMCFTMVIF